MGQTWQSTGAVPSLGPGSTLQGLQSAIKMGREARRDGDADEDFGSFSGMG